MFSKWSDYFLKSLPYISLMMAKTFFIGVVLISAHFFGITELATQTLIMNIVYLLIFFSNGCQDAINVLFADLIEERKPELAWRVFKVLLGFNILVFLIINVHIFIYHS